jgi:dephospho-CoA kinase
MKVIGLTGGIGSGKSTVARFLQEMGAVVIDLDKTGHELLRKETTSYRQVVKAFGKGILATDGEIDRARLGKIVFSNPEALKRLNNIVHPVIDTIVEDSIKENLKKGTKVLVLEAAAMLEAKRQWQADEIWVTIAPEAAVIRRIKERPGYSERIIKARIGSQMTNDERIKKAGVVIENAGTPEELKEKVKAEWEKLLKRL